MGSFVSFNQFIRQGGQATIVLSLRAAEPALELKQARFEGVVVDAFERRVRDLAAQNWSDMASALARTAIGL